LSFGVAVARADQSIRRDRTALLLRSDERHRADTGGDVQTRVASTESG
jgi:hypothetical protein